MKRRGVTGEPGSGNHAVIEHTALLQDVRLRSAASTLVLAWVETDIVDGTFEGLSELLATVMEQHNATPDDVEWALGRDEPILALFRSMENLANYG